MRRKVALPLTATILITGQIVGLSVASRVASASAAGANGKLAFASIQTQTRNGNADIFTMDPDGLNVVNVTNSIQATDARPDWSPDSSRIVFARVQGTQNDPNREIFVINADGTGLERLTNNTAHDTRPAWSPDGTEIVFTSDRDDPNPIPCLVTGCVFDIYVMNADGTNVRRLTDDPANDDMPRFSPDGNSIVFSSDRTRSRAIYTMDTDGSNIVKLTPDGLVAADPDWSAAGDRIVFENNFCAACGLSDIFMMDADGGNVVQLTQGLGNNIQPRWSPDGQKIVFWHQDPPGFNIGDIYTMDADGTGITNLTRSPQVNEGMPAWGSS
jgi:Tol biopolymer transport system component